MVSWMYTVYWQIAFYFTDPERNQDLPATIEQRRGVPEPDVGRPEHKTRVPVAAGPILPDLHH